MIAIRGGMGLGDSLYLQSVARHLVEKGQQVEVCSKWGDVFRPLAGKVTVSEFRRDRAIAAHYTTRKRIDGTDQFQDICLNAGLKEFVDLRIDWQPQNLDLIARLKSLGKPIVAVQMPRVPMGRSDGYGASLLPECVILQRAVERLGNDVAKVQIGAGEPKYHLAGIDLDLANKTSVSDLLDVAWVADVFLGYVSFIVPLAESFKKPLLLIWSRKGLNDKADFIRRITPQKILHRPKTSRFVMDDCSGVELAGAVNELCRSIRSPVAA